MRALPFRKGLTAGFAALTLSACSKFGVDYLQVQPQRVVLRAKDDSVWLSAKGMSQTGHEFPKLDLTWSSKDTSIAKVDSKGRVTPVKSGFTEVVVRHATVEASVPVEVLFPERLEVFPRTLTLSEGEEGQEISARIYDFRGKLLTGRSVTLEPKDPRLVSVSGNKVFPLFPGSQTSVLVRVGNLMEEVEVTVLPAHTDRR